MTVISEQDARALVSGEDAGADLAVRLARLVLFPSIVLVPLQGWLR